LAVEVWKFLRKPGIFELAKFLRKSLEKISEIYVRKKVQILFENVLKFQKKFLKFELLSQKTLFLGQKVWKKFGKFRKKFKKFGNRVFRMSENLEIVLFQNFRKL